jgi:hypothetical protein
MYIIVFLSHPVCSIVAWWWPNHGRNMSPWCDKYYLRIVVYRRSIPYYLEYVIVLHSPRAVPQLFASYDSPTWSYTKSLPNCVNCESLQHSFNFFIGCLNNCSVLPVQKWLSATTAVSRNRLHVCEWRPSHHGVGGRQYYSICMNGKREQASISRANFPVEIVEGWRKNANDYTAMIGGSEGGGGGGDGIKNL